MSAKTNTQAKAANLVAVFEETAQRCGNQTAVNHKKNGKWETVSWSELARRSRAVADGLAAWGIKPGDRVAVIGETNLEWILADLGILGAGAITVTIYQSNLPHECHYILENSGAKLVFCDTEIQAAKIREVKSRLPELKGLICAAGAKPGGFEQTLAQLEAAGSEFAKANPGAHAARVASIPSDAPASFIYTSGTTGNPKGVVLTHGNWAYEATAVATLDLVRPDDMVLMFLPMAHSFAKVIEAVWFATGSSCAFVESMEKIVDNAGEIRPTVMPSVPRIFEKAYNAVVSKGLATPGLKGKLFKMTMEGFDEWASGMEQGVDRPNWKFKLGRKLVFPKLASALKERFGGRMRLFVSGGAPLSAKINHFFSFVGLTILEGYGLTESSAGTFVNRPGKNKIGTVGPPVPGTEVKIAEDGEILIKGPCIMKEYYANPAATAEALHDGWLATGDIGEVDADGCLRITDRKKDIIVTAGGKNVAPQNLENELKTDSLISQVLIHGDKRKFISALVTLNPETAAKWAAEHGVPEGTPLHAVPKLLARIQDTVDALNARTPSYSSIKRFVVLPRDFTQESGELTPTLKLKRKVVTKNNQALLDSLYEE
jgi:long-chain acyl-CoA synthetase